MRPAIRCALESDLSQLRRTAYDLPRMTDWIHRHRSGLGRLFVATLAESVVGRVYLSLEDPPEAGLRRHLPGVTVLQGLEVHKEHRNRGLGAELTIAAENFIRSGRHDRDSTRVALGVDLDNPDPIRLYRRLGYVEWEHGLLDTHRAEHREVVDEPCRVFVKDLT